MGIMLAAVGIMFAVSSVLGQDAAAPAAVPAGAAGVGAVVDANTGGTAVVQTSSSGGLGLWTVIWSSGALGAFIWLGLFGTGGIGVYLCVDSAILIRSDRIMPPVLVSTVTDAMAEGDVMKALQCCENEPGPLANILMAGFSHVEEGFDVIQEAIQTAADLESEKIMQKITWISVMANLAPMFGLLGTVQGMIWAFAQIATAAVDTAALALAIAQALYTTAAGLTASIPCVSGFYYFRNTANRIVLRMQALTMELVKDLRNVEVVQE
jgi:biopolymer transport protein ExbB